MSVDLSGGAPPSATVVIRFTIFSSVFYPVQVFDFLRLNKDGENPQSCPSENLDSDLQTGIVIAVT